MADPREEMNSLCRTAGDFAFEQITKHGGFTPFAVVVGRDGGLRFVTLGDDQKNSSETD